MNLTEILESWVEDAERMAGSPATGVVVTPDLFAALVSEQAGPVPVVAELAVLVAASQVPDGAGLPSLAEMVEIAGPDRVTVYVGTPPEESTYPLGLDPSMPVIFVPIPPARVSDRDRLEMYNRLRWIGLGPTEALAGSEP